MAFCPTILHAANWGKDSLWNDGRAEVAVYDSERVVEGKPRAFKEQLITVKEELAKKARVLKLNQIQKFDIENYPVNVATSVYVLDDPIERVLKITVSEQDWIGNTFKIYKGNGDGAGGNLLTYSNVVGEPEQSFDLALEKDDYFEDQLPLSLRALPFKAGFERKIRLWDGLTMGRGAAPAATEAVLTVENEETVRCRAGSLLCWVVTLKRAGQTDRYWFEKKSPNLLVKMETADGRKRLLYGRARWTYWDRRIPRPNILN